MPYVELFVRFCPGHIPAMNEGVRGWEVYQGTDAPRLQGTI